MPSEFEAAALTRSKVSTSIVMRRQLSAAINCIGAILAALSVLAAIGLLHAVVVDGSHDGGLALEPPAEVVRIAGRTQAARPARDVTPSSSDPQVPLFFGYVAFDWDPQKSGGVAGFAPWPSSPAAAVVATAN
ncbi:MAG: hypothetical protein K2Y71_04735 [Xanthobacteraceae bacterium]|nr:hypothetical protein [Xanthobacteraceae bacterium]